MSTFILERLFFYVIPAVVESTAIPISLFILARKLSPTKPLKAAIKWASISGAFFVLTFWLVNTGMWALTVWGSSDRAKGIDYLISFPQNMAGFLITAVGMLALTIYAAHLARVIKAEKLSELNFKPVGYCYFRNRTLFLKQLFIMDILRRRQCLELLVCMAVGAQLGFVDAFAATSRGAAVVRAKSLLVQVSQFKGEEERLGRKNCFQMELSRNSQKLLQSNQTSLGNRYSAC